MVQPWQTGKVIRIENETAQTRRFWIQMPAMESFDFRPGQFVTLDLPIHEKPNKRWRSYSIASWPDGTNVIELVIVLLEGGLGTNYLFNHVSVGSELTLRGPQGVFTMPETIDRDLFFICTGTGIAPFRSMAHHILNHGIPHKDIYLLFGCRTFGDALYGPELKELVRERCLIFIIYQTYSREKEVSGDELVRDGLCPRHLYEEICQGKKAQAASDELQKAAFFLCGWKNMIDEAKQRIQALGYERKAIHQELYG